MVFLFFRERRKEKETEKQLQLVPAHHSAQTSRTDMCYEKLI
jgi:hypothetical protein